MAMGKVIQAWFQKSAAPAVTCRDSEVVDFPKKDPDEKGSFVELKYDDPPPQGRRRCF